MNPATMVPFPLMGHQSFVNSQAPSQFIPNAACRRCHHGGCDVKIQDCGCLFHAVSGFWTEIIISHRIKHMVQFSADRVVHKFIRRTLFSIFVCIISTIFSFFFMSNTEMHQNSRESDHNGVSYLSHSCPFSLLDANGL